MPRTPKTRISANAPKRRHQRIVGPPVIGAPQWLKERMEKVRKLPAPTIEEMKTAYRASMETRRQHTETGQWPNDKLSHGGEV